MIVTASTLQPDQLDDLPLIMKGNICRCNGYRSIKQAITEGVLNPCARTGVQPERVDGRQACSGPVDGPIVGRSVTPPAAKRVVTGTEPYTFDVPLPGALVLRVLGSPHAHARILTIDTSGAEDVDGVELILTHQNVPTTRFSTARHEDRLDDPDDTRILDDVLRFVGQPVVATTVAAAEEACRRGRQQSGVPHLPGTANGRHPGHPGLLRKHQRRSRPLRRESMSESPYNPVAPALGNAIRRAVGIRAFQTPFSRDGVWRMLGNVPARVGST